MMGREMGAMNELVREWTILRAKSVAKRIAHPFG